MNRTVCSEQDFYLQRERYSQLSFMVVFFVTILHAFVFAGAFALPMFFDDKPIIQEVMTIDLVSMPEPAGFRGDISAPEPAIEPADIVPEPSAPEPEIEAVVIEPAPHAAPQPVVAAEPISLAPTGRKETIAVDTRLEEEKLLADQKFIEERMDRLRSEAEMRKRQEDEQKRLAERAKRAEQAVKREVARAKALEKQAREEAEKARRELALLHKTRESADPDVGEGRRVSGTQTISNALLNQYTANIHARVEQFWQLPGMRQWPEDIRATVEFTVHRDGRITGLRVSVSSGDSFYDRFAKETVRNAAPMPPIPAALRRGSIDYGLVFAPSGVQ